MDRIYSHVGGISMSVNNQPENWQDRINYRVPQHNLPFEHLQHNLQLNLWQQQRPHPQENLSTHPRDNRTTHPLQNLPLHPSESRASHPVQNQLSHLPTIFPPQREPVHWNPHTNLAQIPSQSDHQAHAQFKQYFQQYLSHYAAIHYTLLTTPSNFDPNYRFPTHDPMASSVDIENYINYEVNRQQMSMATNPSTSAGAAAARPSIVQLHLPFGTHLLPQREARGRLSPMEVQEVQVETPREPLRETNVYKVPQGVAQRAIAQKVTLKSSPQGTAKKVMVQILPQAAAPTQMEPPKATPHVLVPKFPQRIASKVPQRIAPKTPQMLALNPPQITPPRRPIAVRLMSPQAASSGTPPAAQAQAKPSEEPSTPTPAAPATSAGAAESSAIAGAAPAKEPPQAAPAKPLQLLAKKPSFKIAPKPLQLIAPKPTQGPPARVPQRVPIVRAARPSNASVARPAAQAAADRPKVEEPTKILQVEVVCMAESPRDRKDEDDAEALPPVEESVKQTVAKIQKSQHHYTQLFGRLTSMLQTLNRRYEGTEAEPEPEQVEDDEEEPGTMVIDLDDTPPPPAKRPRQMSSSSSESHPSSTEPDNNAKLSHYPQRVEQEDGNSCYVLGPNGTTITAQEYGQVFWTNAPVATRCLLGAVFTSDELATHTLTGKPSPAFYGRERPAKKMLDQGRVDDIIVSVRNRTGGKERHIRATITTKCADTAKKYKRRAKKAQQNNCSPDNEDQQQQQQS